MNSVLKFIELDRRFRKLDPHQKIEDEALKSYTASIFGHDSTLSWDDLLTHRLVVVLGEPGSGKTREFREREKTLRTETREAFFVPLDRLSIKSLKEALGREDYRRFKRWRKGDTEAAFFLDSVDEAKIRKTSDFHTALDHLGDAIGRDALTRAQLFFSSRISEWRPQTDTYELGTRFNVPNKLPGRRVGTSNSDEKNEQEDSILVVQLEPLDRTRVELFASERGVSDPAAFVKVLDQHHAWEFARRPIDVVGLIIYWKEHKQRGSFTELIVKDLELKLRETVEREKQDPLTYQQARDGAETLVAAVAFCRQFSFLVPDDTYISDESAIDSISCLPEDWLPVRRGALLSRAVFDSESYGRIRFHHRRVAEYLGRPMACKTHT